MHLYVSSSSRKICRCKPQQLSDFMYPLNFNMWVSGQRNLFEMIVLLLELVHLRVGQRLSFSGYTSVLHIHLVQFGLPNP